MSAPQTTTLSANARYLLREILRSIPGSHAQWADIQDILETDTVHIDELLRVLATVGASVQTIVVTADRELAQLRRERDTVRSYLGTTASLTDLVPAGAAFAARACNIQPFDIDAEALRQWIFAIGADTVMDKLPVYGHPLLPHSTTPTAELAEFIADAYAERVLIADPRLTLDMFVADSIDGLGYHVRILNRQCPAQRFGLIGVWTAFEFADLEAGVFDQAMRYLTDVTNAANEVLEAINRPGL
ncbi:hypothetical protein [Mycobacterium sp. D16R24]|uniref:hypothetical protein n=1 Tax=Mycobacterium sp. D16R24 TaxID=1855656 RepID=UPI0009945D95|nr:hypothetical protein [Mycobacterium sp. D16R24]